MAKSTLSDNQKRKAGQALTLWMKAQGFTDGQFAKKIGVSAASVGNWRGGVVSPIPSVRKAIQKMTKIIWGNPSTYDFEFKLEDILPDVVLAAPGVVEDPMTNKLDAMQGLGVAKDFLRKALQNKRVDLMSPSARIALTVSVETVEAEIERRKKDDRVASEAESIRKIIRGKLSSRETLDFLARIGADPAALALVKLPGRKPGTKVRKATQKAVVVAPVVAAKGKRGPKKLVPSPKIRALLGTVSDTFVAEKAKVSLGTARRWRLELAPKKPVSKAKVMAPKAPPVDIAQA